MNAIDWMKTLQLDELLHLVDGINRETGVTVRTFDTGATRDSDEGKLDYEGFLSPAVLGRFAQYMHKHRKQADGNLRDSDNWQKGIPRDQYMKSAWRHFMSWWWLHRQNADFAPINEVSSIPMSLAMRQELEESVCALLFNAMGYLHELQKAPVQTEMVSMDEVMQSQFHNTIAPHSDQRLHLLAWTRGWSDAFSGERNGQRFEQDQHYRDGYNAGQREKRLREQV